MPTVSENLTTARANYAAILAEISLNPKPTYSVNGQSFSWVEYQRFLLDSIERLDSLILQAEPPYEYQTEIFSG